MIETSTTIKNDGKIVRVEVKKTLLDYITSISIICASAFLSFYGLSKITVEPKAQGSSIEMKSVESRAGVIDSSEAQSQARESLQKTAQDLGQKADQPSAEWLINQRVSEIMAQPAVALRPKEKPVTQAQPLVTTQSQPSVQVISREPEKLIEQRNLIRRDSAQQNTNEVMRLGVFEDGTPMTAKQKRDQLKFILSKLPENFTINWKAPEEKAKLYVFTDTTCPFCRRLHASMDELNAAGISVYYFMYPRDLPTSTSRKLSPTAIQFNNIWCSADQKEAMDTAFEGYKLPATDCGALTEFREPSPVVDHYSLGTLLELQGTPTMITEDGEVFAGFSDARSLISRVLR